jgi:hypothetical protein
MEARPALTIGLDPESTLYLLQHLIDRKEYFTCQNGPDGLTVRVMNRKAADDLLAEIAFAEIVRSTARPAPPLCVATVLDSYAIEDFVHDIVAPVYLTHQDPTKLDQGVLRDYYAEYVEAVTVSPDGETTEETDVENFVAWLIHRNLGYSRLRAARPGWVDITTD